MTEEQLLKYARVMMEHCRLSQAYLDTYKSLVKCHEEYHKEMMESVVFFNVAEMALVSSLMMELCKLFEDDRKVISIHKLLNVCEQNQKLFHGKTCDIKIDKDVLPFPVSIKTLLENTKRKLNEHDSAIRNLKAQRDQLWAHNDKTFFINPDELENRYPVNLQEIENLLSMAFEFPNKVMLYLTNECELPYYNSPIACVQNVEHLMKLIESGKQKEE